LIDWKRIRYALRASRFDAILVSVTCLSAVFISVDNSVLIGVALSIVLFVPRASKPGIRELIVTPERVMRERHAGEKRTSRVLIYDLEGELFFGAAHELQRHFTGIIEETERTGIKHVVLRLRRTRNPDMAAVEILERFLRDTDKRGVAVLLAGLRPDFVKILDNVRLTSWYPAERLFPEENEVFSSTLRAVRYARQLVKASESEGIDEEIRSDQKAPTYYLV
jgi:SulP family sulfate permease